MMRRVAWFACGVTASLGVLLFLGCSPSRKESTHSITVGISPFQDTILPIVGEKKGWYKEEGLNVTFKILGWTEVQEALASGGIDVGVNNISAVVSTHAQFPDLVYAYGFNTFDDGFALMIRPNSGLKPLSWFLGSEPTRTAAIRAAAAQLKGRTVVTTSNTDMEQGVAAAARRGGLDFKTDVTIIDLNPDEGLAAFLGGTGDAYIGGIPQRTRAQKEGMMEMLTGADLGPAPINGFVTTRSFVEANRDDILKLLHVWFRIVNYINANPDEGGQLAIDEVNTRSGADFTLGDFKRFWNRLEHYPASPEEIEREILDPSGRNYWKARWDDCNNYFFTVTARIPEPVDPQGVFLMPEIHAAYVKRYADGSR